MVSVLSFSPVFMSHNRISLEPPPASMLPSGLKATPANLFVYPSIVRLCFPEFASHRRIVVSELPLTRVLPSGLKDRVSAELLCPSSVWRCFPVFAFHRWMVSQLPLTRMLFLGLKAILEILPRCPLSIRSCSPCFYIPQPDGIVKTCTCYHCPIRTK